MSRIAAAPLPRSTTPAHSPRGRLRLTRRGRAVFATLLVAPVLAVMLIAGVFPATATGDVAGGDFEYVTVSAGESLWQIAQSLAPAADPRDVISDIVRLNGLPSWQVDAGESIAIPHAWASGD